MPTIDKCANNPQYQIRMDTTKHAYLMVTLNDPYTTGGLDVDLQSAVHGLNITEAVVFPKGGFTAEWSPATEKLIIYKGGFEVENGHSFYDTASGKYLSFRVEVFNFPLWNNELRLDPTYQIQNELGAGDDRMLRKDIDDTFQDNVTTTVPPTSTLKVEGEQVIEVSASQQVKGELKIASGGVAKVESGGTQTIESGGSQTINAGATQTVAGSQTITGTSTLGTGATQDNQGLIKNATGTLLGTSATPSVAGGTFFALNGALTPTITNFSGGVHEQVIAIVAIVSGCVIYHDPTKIDLQGDVNNTMKAGDKLTLKNNNGVWEQEPSFVKDGTTTIAPGGKIDIKPDATQNIGGEIIKTNPTTFAAADTTPDVSGKNLFIVDGTQTPTITGFDNGTEGQEIGVYCQAGQVTIVYGATILLKGRLNLVLGAGDTISFQLRSGVWVETASVIKNGWVPINDTGMVYVKPGGSVTNEGLVVNTPTVAPASPALDASKSSYFSINGATTPSISSISGGSEGQIIGIGITAGTCTVSEGAGIDLAKDMSFAMNTGDGLTLQLTSGVWKEIGRYVKSGAIMGQYQTFSWSASVSLAPSTSDIYKTTVTSDGVITLSGGAGGLTILILLENDSVANHTVSISGVTTNYSSNIVLKPSQIVSIKFYHDGAGWVERQPEFF